MMRQRTNLRDFFAPSKSSSMPEKMRAILSRLILIRVLVLSVILGIAGREALNPGSESEFGNAFYFIGCIYGLSLANAILVRRTAKLTTLAYLQLGLDVLFATFAISITNSLVSIFLYLLVIVGAAVALSRNGAVVIAAFSGICYALLMSGIIPAMDGHYPSASTGDILVVYMAMVLIALVSGYLTQQLDLVGSIADRTARDLVHLNRQQQQLFDDVSEGIITLDIAACITGINQAARSILGLSQLEAEHFVGKSLSEVLRDRGLADAEKLLQRTMPDGVSAELTLRRAKTNEEIHLDYSLRALSDDKGKESGRILIFNDVSHVRSMEERLQLHEQMTKLLAERDDEPRSPALDLQFREMTGESAIMKRVYTLVERVAASDASTLICGESGTGKELIAKSIHNHGARRSRPFVAINCGAIPENLIESELFGHKKGSFTGAVSDNTGLFRQAQGGTIFLDEIGELPLQMQTKLLRVLQERTIRPVGEVRDFPVDVRVIAATNRDLKKEIAALHFREDLFYRLNVVNIVLPPLRDRRDDIPLLVRHFIGRLCNPDKVLPQISAEALQMLMSYNFPGNIRELENIIERALVLGGQAILPEHLPEEVHASSRRDPTPMRTSVPEGETQILLLPISLESELEKLERHYLFLALEHSGGIKKHAAELLGLNFRSFRYRLKKFGLSDSDASDSE